MVNPLISLTNQEAYQNDLLKRNEYASKLGNLLTEYKSGIVVSINGAYGTGKTYFLKLLMNFLDTKNQSREEKIYYNYFNAWEKELLDNPFSSIFSSLYNILIENDEKFKAKENESKTKESLKRVVKHFLPFIIGLATGVPEISKLGKNVDTFLQSTTTYVDYIISNSHTQDKDINDFKSYLEKFVSNSEQPIFLFIDELDRCSPHYAITFLEVLKHFFFIPNVIFVLAIDKQQILSAIRKEYGDDIDASAYLRKIVSFQYILKKPRNFRYFTLNTIERHYPEVKEYFRNSSYKMEFIDRYLEFFNFNLRDTEKFYTILEIILKMDGKYYLGMNFVFVVFCMIFRIFQPTIFEEIVTNQNIEPFIDYYYSNSRFSMFIESESDDFRFILFQLQSISTKSSKKVEDFFKNPGISKLLVQNSTERWYPFNKSDFIEFINVIDFDS